MTTRYCHTCSVSLGLITPANPVDLVGTTYQLGKFLEHTAPGAAPSSKPVNSLFTDPTLTAYSGYYVSTVASGCAEVDNKGRTNLVWFAGEETGYKYTNGSFVCPQSGIKVVFHDDAYKVHLSPASVQPHSATCSRCGATIAY